MKNVSYSTILFSAFSQDILLSPVRNRIKPITNSMKNLIKSKNQSNKKMFMSSSSLNLSNNNKNNIFPKKFNNRFLINKNKNSESQNKSKQKILYSFYDGKPQKRKKKNKIEQKFTKDFIIMKRQKYNSANPSFRRINYKMQKYNMEPYKKYLIDKNKIEMNRKAKEREMKYILESKKNQRIKMENDIRDKYQGIDFSRQKRREFFLAKYLKSKQYTKKEEKNKNDEDENFYKQFECQHLKERLNFEVNERKYMFLDNDELVPKAKYSNFNQKFKSFLCNLRDNPNLNILINYISKK
jgi:hypothetical protein